MSEHLGLGEPRTIDIVGRAARTAFEIADAERQGASGAEKLAALSASTDSVTVVAMRIRTRMPTPPPAPRAAPADDGRTWQLRASLPSEISHKAALRWPADVSAVTGISEPTLKSLRTEGDTPRLYAIGRMLFTTHADLRDWFAEHELAKGKKLRPATVPKGTKLRRANGTAPQE